MQRKVAFLVMVTILGGVLDVQALAKVAFEQSASERLEEMFNHRKPLSAADTQAKARILSLLKGKKSSVLFELPDFSISYWSTPNVFQVKIRSVDVKQAKQDAVRWFEQHGLSAEAICNYPVMFYPNWDISQQLGQKQYIFNTLSPTCYTTSEENASILPPGQTE